MGKPQLSSKIMNASPCCGTPNMVPNSHVEDNSFGNRDDAPKDNKLLSKDSMGNKSLTQSYPKGSDKGVDKSFLAKAKTDMTKSGTL